MADILSISIEATGFDELEKEVLRSSLTGAQAKQLASAASNKMKEVLARHVEDDVYNGGYYPRMYLRRSDYPQYGKSLKEQALEAKTLPPVQGGTYVAGIEFVPSGEHENYEWDTADGDALIGRIEHKSPMYTYYPKNGFIPDRPFFAQTVEELIDGGVLDDVVAQSLRDMGYEVIQEGVIREPDDGKY